MGSVLNGTEFNSGEYYLSFGTRISSVGPVLRKLEIKFVVSPHFRILEIAKKVQEHINRSGNASIGTDSNSGE
jgi:hypothetical protein